MGDPNLAGAACTLDWNLEKSKTIWNLESQGGTELTSKLRFLSPLSFSLGSFFSLSLQSPSSHFSLPRGFYSLLENLI